MRSSKTIWKDIILFNTFSFSDAIVYGSTQFGYERSSSTNCLQKLRQVWQAERQQPACPQTKIPQRNRRDVILIIMFSSDIIGKFVSILQSLISWYNLAFKLENVRRIAWSSRTTTSWWSTSTEIPAVLSGNNCESSPVTPLPTSRVDLKSQHRGGGGKSPEAARLQISLKHG